VAYFSNFIMKEVAALASGVHGLGHSLFDDDQR
jgi:hypothetical protein